MLANTIPSLDAVNDALDYINRMTIERRSNGRLYVSSKYATVPAILNANGSMIHRYHKLGTGGTGSTAIAMLVRWARGLHRLPLAAWQYWTGDKIALCGGGIIDALDRGGYFDPARTSCVLCGEEIGGGIDWWSLDNVVGPCHWGGSSECRRAYRVRESALREGGSS